MTDYSIPGSNTLLVGTSGSGKTHALRTLVKAGIETFILFTEPGQRTVADVSCEQGLHWHYVPLASTDWDDMASTLAKVNESRDLEALTKRKDWDKTKYREMLEVITVMNDFTCDRCKQSFGGVDTWQTDRAISVDSLSGLSLMAMHLAAGGKPVLAPADWGTAMNAIENFINRMCAGTQCHFVLTAHLERERDEITGGVQLMASTLGQKLAPKLPRYFDDVVQCIKEGREFSWATAARNVDLKNRNLPLSEKLAPNFGPLIDSWMKAGGKIITTEDQVKTQETVAHHSV